MAIKTVLVPVDGSPESLDALNSACLVAKRFNAHMRALHVIPSTGKTMARMSDIPAGLRDEVAQRVENETRQQAGEIQARFESFCRDHDMPLASAPNTAGPSAEWLQPTGDIAETLVRYGRLSDLIVVSRPHKAGPDELHRSRNRDNVESLIMGTGRPLLIIPPSSEGHPPHAASKRIAIGWNESQEAARALSLAIPWLPQMESVTLLITKEREARVQDVLDYLSLHEVKAEVKVIDDKSKNTADALLNACKEVNADILVVGGFSHSRARELFFGGVTLHLLEEASIATLMVH